ncbi:hypothetical protein PIB30_052063 [Stylosanthes scabra]|uniref:Uncharacterized protein n=1 Tax=Stylosanthes scabra TaxID=79078 RepID=A0ABU6WI44_9FABA|nr:hypothetical protein [Stylosanthes scabra]
MPCWEAWHVSDSEAFPQLRKLTIRDCPMLEGEMLEQAFLRVIASLSDVSKIHNLRVSEVPQRTYQIMLRYEDNLSIVGCESVVKSAFKATSIKYLTCLHEIQLSESWCSLSFPDNCLPKSLKKLTICRCRILEFPEQQQRKYNLVELKIERCYSWFSLSLDAFPNLKKLEIFFCPSLESVSMSKSPHLSLQSVTIIGCDNLVSFAGEGLAAPNLTHLELRRCNSLEALPSHMNSLLPSLHTFTILNCQEICRFPEGGWPPNLKELTIGKQWRSLSSMGNLDTFTHLTIYDDDDECTDLKSFPEAGSLPPLPSLTTLNLSSFKNLETLECNELLRLTSLQQLHIRWCNKLENMEGEKLPSSLLLLHIEGCKLLREKCKNKHQQIWPKIEHIPTIVVDRQQIV